MPAENLKVKTKFHEKHWKIVSSEKRYESVDSVRVVCLLRVPGEEREGERRESYSSSQQRRESVSLAQAGFQHSAYLRHEHAGDSHI
jgi:hypothetical protein